MVLERARRHDVLTCQLVITSLLFRPGIHFRNEIFVLELILMRSHERQLVLRLGIGAREIVSVCILNDP